MNTKLVLSIVAVLVILAGGYTLWQKDILNPPSSGTQSYKTYENKQAGISVQIPSDWTIASNGAILRSADFSELTAEERYPDRKGEGLMGIEPIVESGASFLVQTPQGVNVSLTDATRFREFHRTNRANCSNCVSSEEVMLDGEVAFVDVNKNGDKDWRGIETIHSGKQYRINFTYDTFSQTNKDTLERFISSFKFLD